MSTPVGSDLHDGGPHDGGADGGEPGPGMAEPAELIAPVSAGMAADTGPAGSAGALLGVLPAGTGAAAVGAGARPAGVPRVPGTDPGSVADLSSAGGHAAAEGLREELVRVAWARPRTVAALAGAVVAVTTGLTLAVAGLDHLIEAALGAMLG